MADDIVDVYVEGLRQAGLSESTIRNHLCWVSRFVNECGNGETLRALRIADVDAFLARWLPSLSRRTRGAPVSVLRRFLAFLRRQDIIGTDLASQVIGVRAYRDESLPHGIERHEIKRVLAGIDRSGAHGVRDYAILLLMAVYGLRASEVLGLSTGSLDWEHDMLRVERPKTRDRLDLPLLPEVGNALLDYLRRMRRSADTGPIFVFPQKNKTAAVAWIVKRHLRRAGIGVDGRITSLFRHSLAMEMVKQGVSLKDIGDALGHRHPASTYVYAKSDIERLRLASLSCPEGGAPCPSR
jgi:site-specific recombinase XerD